MSDSSNSHISIPGEIFSVSERMSDWKSIKKINAKQIWSDRHE